MSELFTNATETTTNRSIAYTASLVAYADEKARHLLVEAKKDEGNADLIRQSFSNSEAQDQLIETFCPELSTDTLAEADEDTLKRLLASQQSKRSRAKGKEMSVGNYTAMMSAAIAEQIIRDVMGKPRGAAVTGGSATTPFTDADLTVYADDLDLCNRKIRSLQSWKSTHKHLEGSIEWDTVVENIQKLQDLRPRTTSVKVVKEDPKIVELRETLKDVDLTALKGKDREALLDRILQQLAQ